MTDARILLGVVDVGWSKSYAVEPLERCLRACVEPYAGQVDIAWFGTNRGRYPTFPIDGLRPEHLAWADEIVYRGKESIRLRALEHGYTHMLWQGIDCYWENRVEFGSFVEDAQRWTNSAIVGALTTGRGAGLRDYAVCRRFARRNGTITARMEEVPDAELNDAWVRYVRCGFPGSEAMLISRDVFAKITVANPLYQMWFQRDEQTQARLCVEEFFCLEAERAGFGIYCDTDVTTWHAGDDGWAGRWRTPETPVGALTW